MLNSTHLSNGDMGHLVHTLHRHLIIWFTHCTGILSFGTHTALASCHLVHTLHWHLVIWYTHCTAILSFVTHTALPSYHLVHTLHRHLVIWYTHCTAILSFGTHTAPPSCHLVHTLHRHLIIWYTHWVVQWLVDASSVAASGCHRWLALLGERVSKMCKSHLAST